MRIPALALLLLPVLAFGADAPPRVLAVNPPAGAEDVPPALARIEIFFDRDMAEGSHSIVGAANGEVPPLAGDPTWRNARTFVLPVGALAPGKPFALSLNSAKRQGFRAKEGTPLAPLEIAFRTGASPAPVVASTEPAFGALDVDPALDRVVIRFNEEVSAGRMSLVRIEGGERLGYLKEKPPSFADAKTLVIPVQLEAGVLYGVGVNGAGHLGFVAAKSGKAVIPYSLLFRTRAGGAAKAPPLAGIWRGCDDGGDILLDLRADGRYALLSDGESVAGTWRPVEGGIEVRQDGGFEPRRVACRVTPEGALEVEIDGGRILLRKGEAQAPKPAGIATGKGDILHTRVEMMKVGTLKEEVPLRKLWCMNPDGTNRRRISDPAPDSEAMEAWYLADGTGFVYSGVFDQNRSACLQDVFYCGRDGKDTRRLTGAETPSEIPERGYGTIRGTWIDDTDRFADGREVTANIAWWSMKGRFVDRGNKFGHNLFELVDVPAGKIWVRVWVDRHVGSLQIIDVVPGGISERQFRLTDGNWLAGRGSMTPDRRYLVYLSQIAYWDAKRAKEPPRTPLDPEAVKPPRAPEGVGYDTIAVLDLTGGPVPVASWDPSTRGGDFAKDPRLSNDGRLIAFAKGMEPRQSIAVMSLESFVRGAPEVRDLVQPAIPSPGVGVGNACPAWSPDDRRIAFLRYTMTTSGFRGDLWIVDADGGNLRQLTRAGQNQVACWPAWSPDGTLIAFTLVTGRGSVLTLEDLGRLAVSADIWTIAADGSAPLRLTDDGRSSEPTWAP